MKRHQHSRQHRHRPKVKRKKPPLRRPATGSDEEKVLRALLAQMPLVQELARVGQMDLQDAADGMVNLIELHIFIDFGQLCSSKPTGRVHGNRTAVFMISTTCFQAGQHP
jgi:hypothetical protein